MKYYNIPYHNNFYIDKKGNIKIIDINNNHLAYPTFNSKMGPCTIINDETYLIAQLLIDTFIGNISGTICYLDNNVNNVDLSNLKIELNISETENNMFIINGDEFKQIPKYPNYYISKHGVIYSFKSNLLLKNSFDKEYRTIDLYNNNGVKRLKIHRLVYKTWVKDIDSSELINHIDEMKYNPSLDNLEVCDGLYNTRYSIRSKRKFSPYTEETVHEICKMYSLGKSTRFIANTVDVSVYQIRGLIYRMKLGECYSDIAEKYNIGQSKIPNRRSLLQTTVEEICERLSNGESGSSIAKSLKLGIGTVYKIKNGVTWKDVSYKYNFT